MSGRRENCELLILVETTTQDTVVLFAQNLDFQLIQKPSENPLCVGFWIRTLYNVHNSKSYTIIAKVLKNLMIPMFYLRMLSPAKF